MSTLTDTIAGVLEAHEDEDAGCRCGWIWDYKIDPFQWRAWCAHVAAEIEKALREQYPAIRAIGMPPLSVSTYIGEPVSPERNEK